MTTVQVKREEVGEVKDVQALLSRISEKYAGKWVAILETGVIISAEKPEELYELAKNKKSKINLVFQAPKTNQQFFL